MWCCEKQKGFIQATVLIIFSVIIREKATLVVETVARVEIIRKELRSGLLLALRKSDWRNDMGNNWDIPCKNVIEEIKKQLKLQYIEVCFDPMEEIKERLEHGAHVIYLSVIDNESEREKYKLKPDDIKEKYKTKSPRVHYPDLTISQLEKTYRCGVEDEYERTIKSTESLNLSAPKELIFVSLLFLHEAGHWEQLRLVDRYVKKYIDQDADLEKNNYNRQNEIIQRGKRRAMIGGSGSRVEFTTKEQTTLNELQEEYRRIPKEADADQYAFSQIVKIDFDKMCNEIKFKR